MREVLPALPSYRRASPLALSLIRSSENDPLDVAKSIPFSLK